MNHCIRAMALVTACASAAWAQQAPSPSRTTSTFGVFLRSNQIGSEQLTVTGSAGGWTISSSGRIGAPVEVVTRNLQIRYDADWQPLELTIDATVRARVLGIHIVVKDATATTHIYDAGQDIDRADPIAPATVLMPQPFFGAYEAMAQRLRTAAAGSTVPVYQGSDAAATLHVGESETDRIQTAGRLIVARRTRATLVAASGPELSFDTWSDESGHLLRVSFPIQALDYVREDIASVSARRVAVTRPGDETVMIPANGFNLAGTLSEPTASSPTAPPRIRNPAIVLVAGSGLTDRDETVAGIAIFGQLAGALADAGFMVLRYDKRGVGQSGGRVESAGMADYADDLRAVVKFVSNRKDVDSKRIVLVGHSEGGGVALMEAAKDDHVAALVLLATPGMPGGDLILAQQQHALDRSSLADADKQARVDLQKRIHQAVITGKGWEGLPPELRRQVDTPEFQSLLTFDPAKVLQQVRQPIFVVQGSLDTQVDPVNADRLEALARGRKRQAPVQRLTIPGVNHLFAVATTGETDEYPSLKDKQITPSLGPSIASWLMMVLPPPAR